MKNRKKLILGIMLPVLILLIIGALLHFTSGARKNTAPDPVSNLPVSAVPSAPLSPETIPEAPQPEATPEPTEQPPAITPPASYPVDTASGSDIQLWPVSPSSDSDLTAEGAPQTSEAEVQTAEGEPPEQAPAGAAAA